MAGVLGGQGPRGVSRHADPWVSAIVPEFDGELYLNAALDSILA